jgi:hypothetical protein
MTSDLACSNLAVGLLDLLRRLPAADLSRSARAVVRL